MTDNETVLSSVVTKLPSSVSLISSPVKDHSQPIVYISFDISPGSCVWFPSSILFIFSNNSANVKFVVASSEFFLNEYVIGLYSFIAPFTSSVPVASIFNLYAVSTEPSKENSKFPLVPGAIIPKSVVPAFTLG